ncbi:MAG: LysR family transcriptional regulator [Lachnospiraceae bacterium]|nr:LysR family transcriptional regulator [Lachnospiraceae bacterium]
MEQNLNYYKIFYEVAKTGNISKAADALYISQPAVSKSITKLEHSLNHTLFIRSKKGVKLTEEGQTLFNHLSSAFDSIETAEKALKRIGQLGIGQLRIGVSTSLCKYILLPYLQDFIEENPHVKVSIECNPTYETIQLLKQGKIDIGLICETPLDKQFHFMPLRSIQDTFITTQTYLDNLILREQEEQNESPENAFSDLPNVAGLLLFTEPTPKNLLDQLSPKEIIEKSNLMLLDKGNISRNYIDTYFDTNNIKPGQILEINNMDLLIDFATIGMGVACVVREFVTSYIENNQVVEIPLDHEIEKRMIGFIYDEHLLSNTCKKFIGFCK